METVTRRLHSILAFTAFFGTYLVLFPAFALLIQREEWHHLAIKLNRFWARSFFTLSLIPYETLQEEHIDPQRNYILCPNHFSFIDIPSMGLSPVDFKFVGKSSLMKVPLFGYMFGKLHITVDRRNFRDRYSAYNKAKQALDNGFNLVMYPEGGMKTTNPPIMVPFKEGPFRVAIEKKIPIVPVTIPYNWIILPDDDQFLVRKHEMKVIFHKPIETAHLTKEDVGMLKDKVYQTIDTELKRHLISYENRSRHASQNSPLGKVGI